jgi:hypothetical protein
LALAVVNVASAQDNPLAKSSAGDWAKYLVTTKNETIPLMSTKDQQHWRVVKFVDNDAVGINGYFMVGENRSTTGGNIYNLKDRYEPVLGIMRSKQVKVVSTSKEKLTVGGKQYECTKIVRKVDQPVDEAAMESSWIGTSTVWMSDAVPLGLVKMENAYHTRLTKDDEGMKISETWVLAEYGYKDWKEE